MSSIPMTHPDSAGDEPVLVHPGQVENMKRRGWVEADPAAPDPQPENEEPDHG